MSPNLQHRLLVFASVWMRPMANKLKITKSCDFIMRITWITAISELLNSINFYLYFKLFEAIKTMVQVYIYHLFFIKITTNKIYYVHLGSFYLKTLAVIIGICVKTQYLKCTDCCIWISKKSSVLRTFILIHQSNISFFYSTCMSDYFKSFSHDLNHFCM